MIYKQIQHSKKKLFALLIDPDKQTAKQLEIVANSAQQAKVDFIFVGGSLISSNFENCIIVLKQNCRLPIIIFPGNLLQISTQADAILFLMLISGRNPEFLIGNHVLAAPVLQKTTLEIISTGYILINCGHPTSVQYMSNTQAIPYNKPEIAAATALAGEMLGNKLIYLEGGSGADKPVSTEMIRTVKSQITVPLIVGGGLKQVPQIEAVCQAGADIIVCGTAIENNTDLLQQFAEAVHKAK